MKLNITIEIDDAELKEFLGISKKDESKTNDYELSEYARFFDDSIRPCVEDSETRLMFLKNQEKYFNERLKAKGRVFLNEVYDALGIPRTKAGNIVGWLYNIYKCDNQLSFGIYDIPGNIDAINGFSNTFILDFNVEEIVNKF